MAGGRSMLDAATSLQQERIRVTADEAFAEALASFRGNLGGVEQLLRESADAVTARSLADLEGKAESAKHQVVDDLLKSAEWYEKKAQTQIQHFAERAAEQAEVRLRERAGEISSMFAGELDNASRNFVGHTQNQMEEVVRDAFERARALFSEAAETTSAAFIDEIQRQARHELSGFEAEAQKSVNESRASLEAAREDLTQQPLGSSKHALVIEWPPATQGLLRHFDLVSGSFKDLHCRLRRFWMEVVIEGVWPQDHPGLTLVPKATPAKPLLKGLGSKDRHLPLGCHTCHQFGHVAQQRRL